MKKNLILLGMMAVGKTTIGKIVAKSKGMDFVDTDSGVENKLSMTISEIFKKKGEDFFRAEEEKVVLKILERNNCVIALGGGVFINKKLREVILKSSISFWLDINTKTLNKRVKWNRKRPLLKKINNQKKLDELYVERKNFYKLANHKVVCDKLDKKSIASKIIKLYEKY